MHSLKIIKNILVYLALVLAFGGLLSSCAPRKTTPKYDTSYSGSSGKTPQPGSVSNKWDLWTKGTLLRGANIYQRRVYRDLDGTDFMGPGPVGPPYKQKDFDRLAALGANYVNISHPGLFKEKPPYGLDRNIQENLDKLLGMVAKADMFAVVSFRTGPGRSEFTFFLEEVGTWFNKSMLNDAVWKDRAAQDGWVEMWRYTAKRYRNHPVVVGYDLMVEPNANEVWLEIDEPEDFYPRYTNTLYDWNQLYPRITKGIRSVDKDTPILVGGMGYSAVEWLPYLKPTSDWRTVYTAHQYEPGQYTHQVPRFLRRLKYTYPGRFDTDWDGERENFNRNWLDKSLSPMDKFKAEHEVPVAVNEFGLMRWEPGAASFMDDQMDLFEEQGINYAVWAWDPSWEPQAENDAFNFRHGPNPSRHSDISSNELLKIIRKYWKHNVLRPSEVNFSGAKPQADIK